MFKHVLQQSACAAALMMAAVANAGDSLERVGDFALIDSEGNFHQLSRYKHEQALVVMAYNNACASAATAVKAFDKMNRQWGEKGVAFALMDSSPEQNQVVSSEAQLPMLRDHAQLIAETLKLTHYGEVAVLDPHTAKLLYRGPADQKHIGSVLKTRLNGKVTATVNQAASGCDIEFPVRDTHLANAPDYASEVAPIVKDNCTNCHHQGGIGPFAIDSYHALRGWSPMIREVLLTKRMPPMQVDPTIGHFTNASYISDADLQTLVHWIDAGSPAGKYQQDPLANQSHAGLWDWQLGEPDYIVKAPVHEVPATGVLDYIDTDVELSFDEDKWVRAVQFIPGEPAVLHHLLTYVTAPNEDFDGGEGSTRSVARRFLEGYAPGKIDAMTFPEGTGVYIPAGHKLSMQFHYTTNGKAATDATVLGLYFYDEPPKNEYLTRSIFGQFKIPAFERKQEAHATYVFEEDVVVHGLRAHMHFRGHDMQFSAELPDGTVKQLLNVANYSYAWQPTYQLSEPAELPAGTTVHVTGSFDNSVHNPANPDPSKEVGFGLQSWDEMFVGYWSYYVKNKSDKVVAK